jgi:hypothetical protein
MSAVCILAPVIVASWSVFGTAVVAAATSQGYSVATSIAQNKLMEQSRRRRVDLSIPNSELVTERLERNQRITVTRDGVTVSFSRDPRGQAALCVTGEDHSEAELRALGEELGRRVVQQYVYQRLIQELQARHFTVVEEETDANEAIRLKVRLWES